MLDRTPASRADAEKGEAWVDPNSSLCRNVPRIVPTSEHLEGLLGIWELNGEMVRFLLEPETGVLVAVSTGGLRINPIRVISGGTKMGGGPFSH